MSITKIIAMGLALSTMRGEGSDQEIHRIFLRLASTILSAEHLNYKIEIIDKPKTQNAYAITEPNGSLRLEVDEDWYFNLPAGHIWGIVAVLGHEIGHFYLRDRYKEWERSATVDQRQLAADYVSGHVSAMLGLTKEQATWDLVDDQHHDLEAEDWGARIRAVEAGWTAGKDRQPLR